MKATVDRATLAEAAGWVSSAIATRSTMPALAGMQIVATDSTLRLTGHDFEQVHTATVEADVTEPGIVIPVGSMFRDLTGALKGPTVGISTVAGKLNLKAGRAAYSVSTFDGGSWNAFPTEAMTLAGTIDADQFRAAVTLAASAAGREAHTPVLMGIRLEAEAGVLRAIGCNRLRLAVGYCPGWDGGELVALPVASALVGALRGMDGTVTLSVSDGALGLDCGARAVVIRLLDGEYPRWSMLLKETTTNVTVDSAVLREAVHRAALTVEPGGALDWTLSDGELHISATGETSTGSEVIDVDGTGPYAISWTPSTLSPALAGLPAGVVMLGFGGTSTNPPMRIVDESRTFDYVIMPRRAGS